MERQKLLLNFMIERSLISKGKKIGSDAKQLPT